MKYINFKTLTLMLSSVVLLGLSGCGGTAGDPSDSQLVGTPPAVVEGQAPIAVAGPDRTVVEGTSITLDGSKSYDPDGTIVSYVWSIGNLTENGVTVSRDDLPVGTAIVTLTVTDNDGNEGSDTVEIIVVSAEGNLPPVAKMKTISETYDCTKGLSIALDGSESTDPEKLPLTYAWSGSILLGDISIKDLIADKNAKVTTISVDKICQRCMDNKAIGKDGECAVLFNLDVTDDGALSDNTDAETSMVKPAAMVLPLCTKDEGSEPWTSDGTTAGTIMLKDINTGAKGTVPRKIGGNAHNKKFVTIGQETFFPAKMQHTVENSEPYETTALWKSDGTTTGTVMLKDFNNTDAEQEGLAQMVVMGGNLYFRGFDETHGYQIWKSDGTPEGTVKVTNFLEDDDLYDRDDHQIGGLRAMGDIVFFHAGEDYDDDRSLWIIDDGKEIGASKLEITDDSNPQSMKVADGKLYFQAGTDNNGTELWVSDGTNAGTYMINVYPDSEDSTKGSNPYGFTAYNGSVYFSAQSDVNGSELHKTDGTEQGTMLVKDIAEGSTSSNPYSFTVFNGVLYFSAYDSNSYTLWKTDGTTDGTVKVFGTGWDNLYPQPIMTADSKLFFKGRSTVAEEYILYTYDGTASEPTQIVTDENTTYPHNFRIVDNQLWFMMKKSNDSFYPTEASEGYDSNTSLWRTDGTETVMIKDDLCPQGGIDGGDRDYDY